MANNRKSNSRITNIGKSIAFGLGDAIKSEMPAVTSIASDSNREFMKNIYDTLIDIKRGQRNFASRLYSNSQDAKDVQEALDTFKTNMGKQMDLALNKGQLGFTEEEQEKEMSKSMGLDDLDFELGDLDSGDDDLMKALNGDEDLMTPGQKQAGQIGSAQVKAINQSTKAQVAIGQQTANAIESMGASINNQTKTVAAGFAASNKIQAKVATEQLNVMMSMNQRLLGGIKSMNDNLANMVTFNNDVITKQLENQNQYYTDSLEELRKISGILERAYPQQNNQGPGESMLSAAGLTGYNSSIDFGGYFNIVKKNLSNTMPGMVLEQLSDPQMLKMIAADPIGMIAPMAFSMVLPTVLTNATKKFNDAFANFFPAVLGKLSNYADKEGPLGWIAKIFGIQAPGSGRSLRGYEKGPVPFDGMAHRALTIVIPRYLSQIVGLLGGKRQTYDYEEGRFMSDKEMRKKLADEETRQAKAAMDYETRTNWERSFQNAGMRYGQGKKGREADKRDLANFNAFMTQLAKSGSMNINVMNTRKMKEMLDMMNITDPSFLTRIQMAYKQLNTNDRLHIRNAGLMYRENMYNNNRRKGKNNPRDLQIYDNFYDTVNVNASELSPDDAEEFERLADMIRKGRKMSRRQQQRYRELDRLKERKESGAYAADMGTTGSVKEVKEQKSVIERMLDADSVVVNRLDSMISILENIRDNGVQANGGGNGGPTPNPPPAPNGGSGNSGENPNPGPTPAPSDLDSDTSEDKYKAPKDFKGYIMHKDDENEDSEILSMYIKDALDAAREEKKDKEEEEKAERRENETFLDRFRQILKSPIQSFSNMLGSLSDRMYGIFFGTEEDGDKSLIQAITDNIKGVFHDMWKTLYDEFYDPLKNILYKDIIEGGLKSSFQKGIQSVKDWFNKDYDEDEENPAEKATETVKNGVDALGRKINGENNHHAFGRFFRHFATGRGKREKQVRKAGKIARKMAAAGSKDVVRVTKDGEYQILGETVFLHKGETYNKKTGEINPVSTDQGNMRNALQSEVNAGENNIADAIADVADAAKGGGATQKKMAADISRIAKSTNETAKNTKTGAEEKKKPNSIKQGIKDTAGDFVDTFSKYIFGDNPDEKGKQKPFIENVKDSLAMGTKNFMDFFFGKTQYDSKETADQYKKEFRKSIPKGIARGLVYGTGLGAVSAAGGFGLLGSLFLPGGPVGAAVLGLGMGLLSENRKFMDFMFGTKMEDGKRANNGVINQKIQTFVKKNKVPLLGGAIMGTLQGLTGFSIVGSLLSLLPGGAAIGALPALGIGLVGPTVFSMAVAMALKSKKTQELLFGKPEGVDGKKVGGLVHSKMAKSLKAKLPNIFGGAAIGVGANLMLGQMGILGSLALGPYAAAIAGGAIGFGITSKKFKEALFGKQDENGNFIKGGAVDTVKNFFKAELFNPLAKFAYKELYGAKKFFRNRIADMAGSFDILKMLGQDLMDKTKTFVKNMFKTIGGKVNNIFKPIFKPFQKMFSYLFRSIRDAALGLTNTASSVAKSMISVPFKLMKLPINLIARHYRKHGTDEQKARVKAYDERQKEAKKNAKEKNKRDKRALDAKLARYDEESSALRSNGYAATQQQLDAKTKKWQLQQSLLAESEKQVKAQELTNTVLQKMSTDIEEMNKRDAEKSKIKKRANDIQKSKFTNISGDQNHVESVINQAHEKIGFDATQMNKFKAATSGGKLLENGNDEERQKKLEESCRKLIRQASNATGNKRLKILQKAKKMSCFDKVWNELQHDREGQTILGAFGSGLKTTFNHIFKDVNGQAPDKEHHAFGLMSIADAAKNFFLGNSKDDVAKKARADASRGDATRINKTGKYGNETYSAGEVIDKDGNVIPKSKDQGVNANALEQEIKAGNGNALAQTAEKALGIHGVHGETVAKSNLQANNIKAERKEESYRQKILAALTRPINIITGSQKKTNDLLDSILDMLKGAGVLASILAALNIIQRLLSGRFGGNTHDRRVTRDVAQIAANKIGKAARNKLKNGGRALLQRYKRRAAVLLKAGRRYGYGKVFAHDFFKKTELGRNLATVGKGAAAVGGAVKNFGKKIGNGVLDRFDNLGLLWKYGAPDIAYQRALIDPKTGKKMIDPETGKVMTENVHKRWSNLKKGFEETLDPNVYDYDWRRKHLKGQGKEFIKERLGNVKDMILHGKPWEHVTGNAMGQEISRQAASRSHFGKAWEELGGLSGAWKGSKNFASRAGHAVIDPITGMVKSGIHRAGQIGSATKNLIKYGSTEGKWGIAKHGPYKFKENRGGLTYLGDKATQAKNAAGRIKESAENKLKYAKGRVVQGAEDFKGSIQDIYKQLPKPNIKEHLSNAKKEVGSMIKAHKDQLMSSLYISTEPLRKVLQNGAKAAVDMISKGLSTFGQAVHNFLTDNKLFGTALKDLPGLIEKKIQDEGSKLWGLAKGFGNAALESPVGKLVTGVAHTAGGLIAAPVKAVTSMGEELYHVGSSAVGAIGKLGGSLAKDAAEEGGEAVAEFTSAESKADMIKKKAKGGFEWFVEHAKKAVAAVCGNETVKKFLGEGTGQLAEKFMGVIGKLTPKNFASIAKKVAKANIRIAGTSITLGISQLAFSVYDAYSGVSDAAEIWGVDPEDVTTGMKTAAAVMNVIMGLGPMVYVDLAFEAVYLGSQMIMPENPINIKREILTFIYTCLPDSKSEDEIKGLQDKANTEYEQYLLSEYQKQNGLSDEQMANMSAEEKQNAMKQAQAKGAKSKDDYMAEKNDNYSPYMDEIRKTTVGSWLFGSNDENGNYQNGAFANMKDFIFGNKEKGEKSIFGKVGDAIFGTGEEDENGNKDEGLAGQVKKAKDKVVGFATNVANFVGEVGDFIFNKSLDEKIELLWKYFIGGDDENGEYQPGIIPKAYGKVCDFFKNLSNIFDQALNTDTAGNNGIAQNDPVGRTFSVVANIFRGMLGLEMTQSPIKDSISQFLHMDAFGPFTKLFNWFGDKFDSTIGYAVNVITEKGVMEGGWQLINDIGKGLWGWLDSGDTKGGFEAVVNTVSGWADSVSNMMQGASNWFSELFDRISKADGVSAKFDVVKNMLKGLFGIDPQEDLITAAVNGAVNAIRGFFDYFAKKWDNLKTWWKNFSFTKALKDTLTDMFPKSAEAIKKTFAKLEDDEKKENGGGGIGIPSGYSNSIRKDYSFADTYGLPALISGATAGGAGIGDKYYMQNDPRWASKKIFGNQTSQQAGCGFSAVANNAMDNLGVNITPDKFTGVVDKSDIAMNGTGLTPGFIPKAVHSIGGDFVGMDPNNEDQIAAQLNAGIDLIAGGRSLDNGEGQAFTESGHYVNLKGLRYKGGTPYTLSIDSLGGSRIKEVRLDSVLRDVKRKDGPGMIGAAVPRGMAGAIPGGVPIGPGLFGGGGEGDTDKLALLTSNLATIAKDYTRATFQGKVYTGSQLDDGSRNNGGSSGGSTTNLGNVSGDLASITKGLQQLGFTPVAAAGIAGNIMQESTCDPNADNGSHHGLVQWDHANRWASAQAWISSHGMDPNSIAGQLAYVAEECKQSGLFDQMNNCSSPDEAARLFEHEFERSGGSAIENRVSYAEQAYSAAGGGGLSRVLRNYKKGRYGGGGVDIKSALDKSLSQWVGQTMPSGPNGCAEATVRIGSAYSPFLKSEYDKGQAAVVGLLQDAKAAGVPIQDYSRSNLSLGDAVTWDESSSPIPADQDDANHNNHVGIYIGDRNGEPYAADNSSSKLQIVERPLERDWQHAAHLIKTGDPNATGSSAGSSGNNGGNSEANNDPFSLLTGNLATIAKDYYMAMLSGKTYTGSQLNDGKSHSGGPSGSSGNYGSGKEDPDVAKLPHGDAANKVAVKFNMPAKLVYAQMQHETGDFTNWGSNYHNYSGMTGDIGYGTSGDKYNYTIFGNDDEWVDYYGKTLANEPGIHEAHDAASWAHALKEGQYYEADESEYANAVQSFMNQNGWSGGAGFGGAGLVQGPKTATQYFLDKFDSKEGARNDKLREKYGNIDYSMGDWRNRVHTGDIGHDIYQSPFQSAADKTRHAMWDGDGPLTMAKTSRIEGVTNTYALKYDGYGNLIGYDGIADNLIDGTEDEIVKYSKQAKQIELYMAKHKPPVGGFPQEQSSATAQAAATLPSITTAQPNAVQAAANTASKTGTTGAAVKKALDISGNFAATMAKKYDLKFDGLGNLSDLKEIPDELKITGADDDTVKYDKQARQIALWMQKNPNGKPLSASAISSAFSRGLVTGQDVQRMIAKYGIQFDESLNVKMPDFEIPSEFKINGKEDQTNLYRKQGMQVALYASQHGEPIRTNKYSIADTIGGQRKFRGGYQQQAGVDSEGYIVDANGLRIHAYSQRHGNHITKDRWGRIHRRGLLSKLFPRLSDKWYAMKDAQEYNKQYNVYMGYQHGGSGLANQEYYRETGAQYGIPNDVVENWVKMDQGVSAKWDDLKARIKANGGVLTPEFLKERDALRHETGLIAIKIGKERRKYTDGKPDIPSYMLDAQKKAMAGRTAQVNARIAEAKAKQATPPVVAQKPVAKPVEVAKNDLPTPKTVQEIKAQHNAKIVEMAQKAKQKAAEAAAASKPQVSAPAPAKPVTVTPATTDVQAVLDKMASNPTYANMSEAQKKAVAIRTIQVNNRIAEAKQKAAEAAAASKPQVSAPATTKPAVETPKPVAKPVTVTPAPAKPAVVKGDTLYGPKSAAQVTQEVLDRFDAKRPDRLAALYKAHPDLDYHLGDWQSRDKEHIGGVGNNIYQSPFQSAADKVRHGLWSDDGPMTMSRTERIAGLASKYALQFDGYGNLVGYDGPADNLIDGTEDQNVKYSKQAKQIELYMTKHKPPVGGITKEQDEAAKNNPAIQDALKQNGSTGGTVNNMLNAMDTSGDFAKNMTAKYGLTFDEFGNLKELAKIPDNLKLDGSEDETTKYDKQAKQIAEWVKQHPNGKLTIGNIENAMNRGLIGKDKVAELVNKYKINFDGLLNVAMDDYKVPDDIKIKGDEEKDALYHKQALQILDYAAQHGEKLKMNKYSIADTIGGKGVKFKGGYQQLAGVDSEGYQVDANGLRIHAYSQRHGNHITKDRWGRVHRRGLLSKLFPRLSDKWYAMKDAREYNKQYNKMMGYDKGGKAAGGAGNGATANDISTDANTIKNITSRYNISYDGFGNVMGIDIPPELRIDGTEPADGQLKYHKQGEQIKLYAKLHDAQNGGGSATTSASGAGMSNEQKQQAFNQEIQKYGITFDGFGNVQGVDIPDQYKITEADAGDPNKIYGKQYEQVMHYGEWKNGGKPTAANQTPAVTKAVSSAVANAPTTPYSIDQANQQVGSNATNTTVQTSANSVQNQAMTGSVDRYMQRNSNDKNNELLATLNRLDIHEEMRSLLGYMDILVKNQADSAKAMMNVAKAGGNGGSGVADAAIEALSKRAKENPAAKQPAGGGASGHQKRGNSGGNSFQAVYEQSHQISTGGSYANS